MIPQIIFYGLAALTAGLLNAHRRFGPPMYTPILNNLAVIAVFLAFHQAYEKVTLDTVTNTQLLIIGLGTTAGVVLMAFAQLPFLKGLGKYRATFSLKHPSVKKLARLSVFVIGYVMVNQIGYLIIQVLAAGQQGGYAAYVNSFTFFMLPHGLFAVSVITALLPGMSAHSVNQEWDQFRERLSTGIRGDDPSRSSGRDRLPRARSADHPFVAGARQRYVRIDGAGLVGAARVRPRPRSVLVVPTVLARVLRACKTPRHRSSSTAEPSR